MLVPVFCSLPNSLTNLFPRVEAFAFQGQRAQNFPPRLDQVEVSCILGLKHKLPAGMVQAEQQHIGRPVCRQVVQDRIDLQIVWQPLIYFLQEIHKVLCRTARIRFGKNFPVNRFECAEGVAFSTSTIINLLLGSFSWLLAVWMMNQLMSRIAFCRIRSHFIQANCHTSSDWLRVQLGDKPLFSANSGSTLSPNQVSCLRQRNPSASKISSILVRLIGIPLTSFKYTSRRSSVQLANGNPKVDGFVRAVATTSPTCSGVYRGGLPGRSASCKPANPLSLKRFIHFRH